MVRRVFGRLGDGKGGEVLRNLKNALTAQKGPPRPERPSDRASLSIEQELLRAAKKKRFSVVKATKVSRKVQGKQNVTLIKPRSKAEREQLIAAQQAASQAIGVPREIKGALRYDFGEAAFERLAPYRASLEGFVATHLGSASPTDADRRTALDRLRSGAHNAHSLVDAEDGHFLGYDFGTSTTKVVSRYPYGGVDEAFAIDVPSSICADGQAHLWPTAVWCDRETGQFSLVPEGSGVLLDSFKAALLQKSGHRICKGSGVTMEEAATAFVALHLAYSLGAASEEVENFRLAGVNIGVPVAALTDRQAVGTFERIVRAALALVPVASELSLDDVRSALAGGKEGSLPHTLHAELSGAIAGYCAAPRFYIGGHMIIDCGSATLDMASFGLDQRNRPIGIYGALVENLGADACQSFLSRGVSVDDCEGACRFEEHCVFRETLQRHRTLFEQEDRSFPYQIILIGGGIHSAVHAAFLAKLEAAFTRPFHRPQIAPTLRFNKNCEAGRLILADGLARDPIDLKEVRLPAKAPVMRFQDPQYIGPEQV